MNAFKAFVKPFQAPQKSVKIKLKLNFILLQFSEMHGAGRVNVRLRTQVSVTSELAVKY